MYRIFPTMLIQMKQFERQKEALQTENEALKQRERYALSHNLFANIPT